MFVRDLVCHYHTIEYFWSTKFVFILFFGRESRYINLDYSLCESAVNIYKLKNTRYPLKLW